ncbi:OsmC family protein [Reichenbachiella carrageenanivorans]|uniref:OsmC family protein n=1 Tax=Reichenbachiella carrageenanivorans TaxID=2979869 RepID=A0ABY6D1Y1_9BACT|nr:OsmC family protein [Reichenbachiella carrageenanivorans]UXX80172.1 OsmC family protein [Reichenbachiella carrageenanivorans]
MGTLKNEYLGNLRTEGTHLPSGNKIITDAPVDNMGKGEAFSPTDLMSFSLSACMMTIMGQVADREHIAMEGLTTDITKVMSAQPRKVSEIHVNFNWPKLDLSDKQKTMLINAAKTCPVALSIHPDIKLEVTFNLK